MILERTTDGQRMQRIIEHPSVFPHVSLGDAHVDLVKHVENPENICLMNEWGGFLFVKLSDTEYEVHTQFLPQGRGRRVIKAAREALNEMFRKCERITTYVPDGNKGADSLCRAFRFASDGRCTVMTAEGRMVDMERRYLTRERFVCPLQQ